MSCYSDSLKIIPLFDPLDGIHIIGSKNMCSFQRKFTCFSNAMSAIAVKLEFLLKRVLKYKAVKHTKN